VTPVRGPTGRKSELEHAAEHLNALLHERHKHGEALSVSEQAALRVIAARLPVMLGVQPTPAAPDD
jgi:hypothetical protein